MRVLSEGDVLVMREAGRADFTVLGQAIGASLRDGDVLLMNGELGAGKTSLAQAIARGMGIEGDVVSPTFNIVCSYEGCGVALDHFDLYRLDAPEELEDVGFWELVDEGSPGASLIEWAELFPDEMPEDALEASIRYAVGSADVRDVRLTARGARSRALLRGISAKLKELA